VIQNIRPEAILCPGIFTVWRCFDSRRLVTVAGESQIGSVRRDAARHARTFNIARTKASS
jgi:hypothetical protein